jgi:hypothetical protein
VRFQPSVYSDVAASASSAGEPGSDLTGNVAKLGMQVASMGLDAWQAKADARADKWRALAAKKDKQKRKKQAAARAAAAMQSQPAALPPTPVVETAMNPWMKWGLIAAGVGIAGFALYMVLKKKDEPPKPKANPKRTFVKNPPKPRVTKVRPAATEIPETIEVEEIEEVEDRRNPARDDEGYDEGYDGPEEGDE